METTYQLENQTPQMEEPKGSYLDSPLPKRILIICVTKQNYKFYYAYWGMTTGLLITVHLKKELTGPGPHLRPVHADHARPPLQWTLDSVLNAYGNYNRRIRPPLDKGILKITSRLLIA